MEQQWAVSADGGYLSNNVLSKIIRYTSQPEMVFRQFVRVEPGYGKNKGDRVFFNRVSNTANQGGTISETSKMPETKVVITQGSCIVNEYGQAIPYTGKLEALSESPTDNIWIRALQDDMKKALNTGSAAAFLGCKVKYTPTGTSGDPVGTINTTGTVTDTATRHVSMFDVKEVVDYMSNTLFVPPYLQGDYMCVANRSFLRRIWDDPEWQMAYKYGKPEQLFSKEVGRIYNCRFIEDNQALSKVLGTTAYKGEAVFFGFDPVVEGLVIPEEIRAKIPTDYGRDKGIAWLFLGGWAETFNVATAGQAKIVHVTSV
jgi:N4-gp56 family major capsid protein